MKKHTEVLNAINVGDVVITAGGIVAKVMSLKEDELIVEISQGVEVKLLRRTVADVLPKARTPASSEAKKSAKKAKNMASRP